MRFKIDWASVIVGSEFTVFALLYFVFEGNFLSTSPRGAYIWRGYLTEGFLRYRFGGLYLEGLVHGGAYFRIFTVLASVFDVLSRLASSGRGVPQGSILCPLLFVHAPVTILITKN